jgi:hypothetical protein
MYARRKDEKKPGFPNGKGFSSRLAASVAAAAMATTALAQQLQALSTAASNAPPASSSSYFLAKNKQHIKPSILFDPREAADVDSSTLFSLALSGCTSFLGLHL